MRGLNGVQKFYGMLRYARREHIDVLICLDPRLCQICSFVRKITGGNYPIVSWIHFTLNAPGIKKHLLKYADFHLAISTGIKKQLKQLHIKDERVFTIFNPVQHNDKLIQRPKDKTVFIYVGRIQFEEQKRMKDLIDTLALVKGKWKLVVFGSGEDIKKCKMYAKSKKIGNNVIWKGWVIDPWDHITTATALVLTSAYEGFGMVLAEAISRGVYCVSSNCEVGPSDIISSGVNGDLYQPGNLDQLKKILQNIVDSAQLPNQNLMKQSLNKFYVNQYRNNLLNSLDTIVERWNTLHSGMN